MGLAGSLPVITALESSAVRSLAWAIGSPSLMRGHEGFPVVTSETCANYLRDAWPWLEELDANPAPLLQHLDKTKSWLVGYRFEALLSFWLDWHPEFELLAMNLQVRDGGHTHGAFDFILRNQAGENEHWEAAVKFYLKAGPADEWSGWIGPGKRDRLDIKVNRMSDHQLPLSSTAEGLDTLKSLDIHSPPQQRAFVKGMLFQHWQEESPGPPHCGEEQPQAVWMHISEFADYAREYPEARWQIREKPDWLSPVRTTLKESLDKDALLIDSIARPQMLSQLNPQNDEIFIETERLFIVPNDWLPIT